MSNLLGAKIKKLRKDSKLTLDSLASLAEISKSYLWELENNAKKPSAEILDRIAKQLNVTSDFLIDEQNSDPSDDVNDTAFFRSYKNLGSTQKEQIRQIMDVLKQTNNRDDDG